MKQTCPYCKQETETAEYLDGQSGHESSEMCVNEKCEHFGEYMDILKRDDEFRYKMLGRLKSDCEYYLGYGYRNSNRLWAGNESKQIEAMKALHNSFDDNEKPEWLTWEQILDYERQMLVRMG